MPTLDFLFRTLQEAVASGETTLDDVIAQLADGDAVRPDAGTSAYPTLAAHVDVVTRMLSRATRETWRTHFRRLVDGTPAFCSCACDECLDLTIGCRCDCDDCGDKLGIAASADLVLRPNSVRKSDVETWGVVAQRMAAKKAIAENRRRHKQGLSPKPTHGKGGAENAITAYRHLFQYFVDDETWTTNPAMKVKKPKRDDTVRRSLHDGEVGEFLDVVVTGGDDTALDFLLVWAPLESGACRQGLVSLTVGDLKHATQMLRLHEKNKKDADQPVSAELLVALQSHAIERGGERCDPSSPSFDPDAPVLYFKDSTPTRPHPLSERRFDTLYRRVQKSLPWAKETMVTNHSLRKTGASIVERIAGSETARHFLRHGRRNVSQTYTEASMERLAEAVEVYTGRRHPAAGKRDERS